MTMNKIKYIYISKYTQLLTHGLDFIPSETFLILQNTLRQNKFWTKYITDYTVTDDKSFVLQ